jgi:hypothetical protein
MVGKILALIATAHLSLFAWMQAIPAKAVSDAAKPSIARPLPFKAGESLTYEVSFSKLIFSGMIGELRLHVTRIDEVSAHENNSAGLVELKAEAVSKGFFPRLFGMRVHDQFITEVSAQDFSLRTSVQKIDEGKKKREQRAMIDPETNKVVYTEQNLLNKTEQPKMKEGVSSGWVLDLLSAIYFLRTRNLETGKVISLPVTEAAKFYEIEVVVLGREEVKVDSRRLKAIKLDVKAFDGKYTKRKGEMQMWVSDDEARLPVRARIKSSGATVTIVLKNPPAPQSKSNS